jgi:uncharacterized membrane protein
VTTTREAAAFRLLLSRLLLAGVSLAAGLMVIGLLAALAVGWTGSLLGAGPVQHEVGDFSRILPALLELRPFAIAQLGLLVLLATPVLRVATSMAVFAVEGDRLYAAISAIVLAVLLTSIFVVR